MASYDNVKFTKGSDVVYVGTIQVEENIINTVKVISIPTLESAPEDTQILNLNKVEDRYTLTGTISYGKLDASETKTSAKDKKDLLKEMFAKGSVVVFTYEGEDYNISVTKFNIKDKSHDGLDSVDGEAVYDVIISCVVGTDVI